MKNLQNRLEDFMYNSGLNLPDIIIALLILLIGYFIARFLRNLTKSLLDKTGIDKHIKNQSSVTIADFLAKLVYFIIMILVFMIALEKLGVTQVLEPLKDMLGQFMSALPSIIVAGIIGYIGYMLATIISELVELGGTTIQNFAGKLNLKSDINLVNILKRLVFIFVFVPILIIAFEKLNMNAISDPATDMLRQFITAIPQILVATVIILLFVLGGRYLVSLLEGLLNSLKINNIAEKMNLRSITGTTNVTKIISNIVYAFIVLFGLITAFEKLGFERLNEILYSMLNIAGNVIFGLIILMIGVWIANIAANNLTKKDGNGFIGSIVRVAIIAVFLAMGLRTMGIANSIINLAFGITLGTIALTIILSFGLGGKEAGGEQMKRILEKFRKKD